MPRPYLAALAALALIGAAGGCGGSGSKPPYARSADSSATAQLPPGDYKIGLVTGTVSQGEEDFRGGEQVVRKYGARATMVTYPDNFMNEQDTVIGQMVGLAADPAVKVILLAQAVPGAVAAARKIREQRPDILIAFVNPHEDPAVVDVACDIAIQPDQITRGRTIVEAAKQMGAETFLHYSFPRHMSQEMTLRRRDAMKETCARLGMKFVLVTATDPMGEGGLPAAQQFALEDVPRKLGQYGPKSAFYCTNDGMQEPIIKALLRAKAGYLVEQDVPGPTSGYPAALGIEIPREHAGDMAWLNDQIRQKVAMAGMAGHFGSWAEPVDMVCIRALADLLMDAVAKRADFKDMATVQRYLEKEANGPVQIRRYDESGNQFLIVLDHVTY